MSRFNPRGRGKRGKTSGYRHRNGDLSLSAISDDAGYINDPTRIIRNQINDALDPTKAPSKPKTWAQMTESERAEMRRLYEGKR